MRRISTLGWPKLISRHRGLPVAPKSFRQFRGMHVAQRAGCLEFDDDQVLDQAADGEFANDHVVVKNDSPLLDSTKPALSHLVGKAIFGNLFNQPMSERIGNPESAPNDPFSRRLQQPRIPFIHLHPANQP
jgi:hypothetical protein